MKIIIIRHAEPDYANDTLTEKGFREAKLLGEYYDIDGFDEIYTSPLNRALFTCEAVVKGKKEIHIAPWLKEFYHPVVVEGKTQINWDLKPKVVDENNGLFDIDRYLDTEIMRSGDIRKYIEEVYEELDKVMFKYGYKKNGMHFDVIKSSKKTIVFFCHLGMMSVIMSYFLNIPYIAIAQGFCALPTGVTTLVSEERREGEALFRTLQFGDLTHLKIKGEELSFAGRFCETFDSEERH